MMDAWTATGTPALSFAPVERASFAGTKQAHGSNDKSGCNYFIKNLKMFWASPVPKVEIENFRRRTPPPLN
jgi:hypothetical protein